MTGLTRRRFLELAASAAGAAAGGRPRRAGGGEPSGSALRARPIPRTREPLPVVGLGTWQTFDVGPAPAERAPLAEVLRRFLEAGGRVVDTSPMYGRAEGVLGDLLARARETRPTPPPFLATKVWTTGRAEGERQVAESFRLLRTDRIDLFQIHNLVDWRTHLPPLRAAQEAGRIRYLGVTHYHAGALAELERVLRAERFDFVQLPYSVRAREAEARLLPAAAELGVAVLVNRPFEEGALFAAVRGESVPPWAAEMGCETWGELFLKFVLAHPAVTAVLPATANPTHAAENLRAGTGPLPDERLRRLVVEAVGR
jgi:aryl-alcohol dehydrogenase-like predicted oxidoreductase